MSQPTMPDSYGDIHSAIVHLLEEARHAAARSVNALMSASYWEIGRRIVEAEQGGQERAEYGKALLKRLSTDLTTRFGRGFSERNLEQMRGFYLCWPTERISQTVSAKLGENDLGGSTSINLPVLANIFPLPWSAYVRLLSVKNAQARAFYETEALRGGWTVRQLDRQINSQFFERTALSRNQVAMLEKGEIDLLFFHRCLKCLVIIDLKAGRFSYADVGQMHLYLNYAKAHWMREGENPPIGLILCASKDAAEAHYALDGLPNTILAAEYKTVLPSEKQIEEALQRARLDLENRRLMMGNNHVD